MKKTLYPFILLAAALMLSSCASNETANSDTVKQSEIHQAYTLTYEAGDLELTASASFRFGGSNGTTLHLVPPSSITLNGEEMASGKNFIQGTFYELSKQGTPASSYTFVFTDCDRKTYKNTFIIRPVSVTVYPQEVISSNGFDVQWDIPLAEGETMELYIEDNKNFSTSVYTNLAGATYLSFSAEDLKNITPGTANIYLVRKTVPLLKEATHLGGSAVIRFVSNRRKINVQIPSPSASGTNQ